MLMSNENSFEWIATDKSVSGLLGIDFSSEQNPLGET